MIKIVYLYTNVSRQSKKMKKHYFKKQNLYINEFGELFRGNLKLSESVNNVGYINDLLVSDEGKRINVKRHSIVAQMFHNKTMKRGYVINHKDEDKLNNASENLEWTTPKYNVIYSQNNFKNNLELFKSVTRDEMFEINLETQITAIETVLADLRINRHITSDVEFEYLEKFITNNY